MILGNYQPTSDESAEDLERELDAEEAVFVDDADDLVERVRTSGMVKGGTWKNGLGVRI